MKTYTVEVVYYIQAESEEELDEMLEDMEIKNNEYYGGYEIVDEDDEEEDE